jgi:hypothetical protein
VRDRERLRVWDAEDQGSVQFVSPEFKVYTKKERQRARKRKRNRSRK